MEQMSIAQEAVEEHARLTREIEMLKLRLAASSKRSPSDWFEHCTEHFRHFHTQLRKHMEMEEYGGFMKHVRERRPTLTHEVEALQRQHRQMLHKCVNIESYMLDGKQPPEESIAKVREDIEDLLRSLHDHEITENKLVQQAFVQDIGAGD